MKQCAVFKGPWLQKICCRWALIGEWKPYMSKKCLKISRAPKKKKITASCCQDLLTDFWHVKGAMRSEFVFICKPFTLSGSVKHWESWKDEFGKIVLTWSRLSFSVTAVDNTEMPERLQICEVMASSAWIANHTAPTCSLLCLFTQPFTLSGSVKHWESWKDEFEKIVLTWSRLSFSVTAVDNTEMPERLQICEVMASSAWIANHTAPHVAPWNLCLFPRLERRLRGYHCASDDEVEATLWLCFRHQIVPFCRDGHIGESVQTATAITWSHNCTDVQNAKKCIFFCFYTNTCCIWDISTDGWFKIHQEKCQATLNQKRLTGRPKVRWKYAVENDIRKTVIFNWRKVVQDRDGRRRTTRKALILLV